MFLYTSDSIRKSYQQFSFELPDAFHCKRRIVIPCSVKQVVDAGKVKLS